MEVDARTVQIVGTRAEASVAEQKHSCSPILSVSNLLPSPGRVLLNACLKRCALTDSFLQFGLRVLICLFSCVSVFFLVFVWNVLVIKKGGKKVQTLWKFVEFQKCSKNYWNMSRSLN